MPAHVLSVRIYVLVLVILTALTAVTIWVSLSPLEGRWHVAAGLTCLRFPHAQLRFESAVSVRALAAVIHRLASARAA